MESEPRSSRDDDLDTRTVVRDIVGEDRSRSRSEATPGTTASADAVEALRRSLRDLKHDVRMLKVGMDKQTQLLEELGRTVDELRRDRARRD